MGKENKGDLGNFFYRAPENGMENAAERLIFKHKYHLKEGGLYLGVLLDYLFDNQYLPNCSPPVVGHDAAREFNDPLDVFPEGAHVGGDVEGLALQIQLPR